MYKIQTVYLPVKVEDEKIPEYTLAIVSCEGNTHFNQVKYYASHFKEDFEMVTHWLKPQEAFVFTPEQLNEYTQSVIKQTLETAAEKATLEHKEYQVNGEYISQNIGQEVCIDSEEPYRNYVSCDKQSITNTFEETFKKFEV